MVKVNTATAVTVATAGTRVQITSTLTRVSSLIIQAANTNSGRIYVGDSTVSAANGLELNAGESLEVTGDNRNNGQADEADLSDIWIDASANAQSVKVAYFIKNPK